MTIKIGGNIYDKTNYVPLPRVQVTTSSGYRTYTDSSGRYDILAKSDSDSIWFSYENKNTIKYNIDTIVDMAHFDLSIRVVSPIKNYLPTVVVRGNKDYNYYLDSIETRKNYANIFNPDKGGVRLTNVTPGTFGVAVDFDALINALKFKQNKRKELYKNYIIGEEQYKYIHHRYTPSLVSKLTHLSGDELKKFMQYYEPTYYMLTGMNEWDLGIYIENCLKEYNSMNNPQKVKSKSRGRSNIFAEPED